MSSATNREAEKKFWQMPELVEQLLPFLDPGSVSRLAELHPLTVEILEGAPAWRKLMLRSRLEEPDVVEQITKILQRMENPKPLQLDLLECICQKKFGRGLPKIRVSCPCNPSGHLVSKEGFLLLEAVEGAFASADQQIEKISVRELRGSEGLLSALSSRAERQQGKVSNLVVDRIRLDDLNSAKLLHSLFKSSRRVTGHTRPFQLRVEGEIGMEGWEALAKAVDFHPVRFYMLTVSKKVMLS